MTAKDKQQTSNKKATGKVDAKQEVKQPTPPANKEDQKAPVAEKKAAEPKVIGIDDISSPALGQFRLKSKGKIVLKIEPKELAGYGLPVFDAEKFAKRNNYLDLVKHELVNMIKAKKFDTKDAQFSFTADEKKFPKVDIVPPAPKKTAKSSTSNVEVPNVFEADKTAKAN
jgi:hypothetical protein